ncbi:DUF445 family protein [Rhodococcus antarcticus]|uniref:DUF445 family protein n=1 Tax=Rhodococcus antarcticus TaxID=2987751 RepID=A0ABY6P545_9NOCA|nr:DUF445 family protein [Rhodococcus antarcticus]UZJ26776.1 DUF445 family protein [Rhodococcus antarcticus]
MKTVATGFLALATVVYLLARWQESRGAGDWVGYVRAASEAGMVGAIADWFAVTALFRHPLGLPIPHTAIIPRKKDQLGASLGEFVGVNFLAPDVVVGKLRAARVPQRLGRWVAQPENAARITAEAAVALKAAVTVLRDEDVQRLLDATIVRRITDLPWGPPLGKLLGEVLADGKHRKLVDLVCDRAYDWAIVNHDTVVRVVSQQAPTWSPRFLDDMLADRLHREVLDFARAVRDDQAHPLRTAIDRFLAEFAQDLQHDPETIARAEAVKAQVLEHPEVQNLAASAWNTARRMVLEAADDPSSELRRQAQGLIAGWGERLATDDVVRGKVDGWLESTLRYVVANYADEITSVITDTVARWDAAETSRKIELQVGRDLQFIRINGTVVGALAGLVIYAVSQALF